MIITINLLHFLYIYLIGAFLLSLIMICICINKHHKIIRKDIKGFILSCMLSWSGILYLVYEFLQKKINKK